MILSGRGWGKTRVGAEDTAHYAYEHPGERIAIVAQTFGDGRDVCIEGESGLLSVLPPSTIEHWNRSMGELILKNGARFKIFTGEDPEGLRGFQHHRAWCDELAAWKFPRETWDMLLFGLRLGPHPQVVVTTTPKPIPIIKDLVRRAADPTDVVMTTGSTFDNAANLSPAALNELRKRYEGTRLGSQELHGNVLDEVEGALWHHALIDKSRLPSTDWLPHDMAVVVVAVDPNTTSGEDADEAGIVVAGKGLCRWCGGGEIHAFVLGDHTPKMRGPTAWANAAVRAYHAYGADRVVPEINNGGEMVLLTIKGVDQTVAVRPVTASRGKKTRAEPVAILYEQGEHGRVHHVGSFPELEDEMCTWEPEDSASPNRMDALVWAITDLMLSTKTVRDKGQRRNSRVLAGRR